VKLVFAITIVYGIISKWKCVILSQITHAAQTYINTI